MMYHAGHLEKAMPEADLNPGGTRVVELVDDDSDIADY